MYAVDLRGHGDSAWSVGGQYRMPEFVLDVATLGARAGPHPADGHRALAGRRGRSRSTRALFPQHVSKLVRDRRARAASTRADAGVAAHAQVDQGHAALRHAQAAAVRIAGGCGEAHAGGESAPHGGDGAPPDDPRDAGRTTTAALSWKFDNYVRLHSPYEFNIAEAREIWNQIRCPVLLIRGSESWASDPEQDGKATAFHDYRSVLIKDAGHWVHHDQLETFMTYLWKFLDE